MTTRDPLDMMLSGRMDRRAFNQTLASLGLGLATVPLATQAATKEAHYYTWAATSCPSSINPTSTNTASRRILGFSPV